MLYVDSFVKDIVLLILLGGLIGLRNEVTHAKRGKLMLGGIRTFMFLAVLGYLNGYVYTVAKLFVIMFMFMLSILVGIYYFDHLIHRKARSLSMELSALITFLLGFLYALKTLGTSQIIAVSLVVVTIMTLKRGFKKLAFKLDEDDLKRMLFYLLFVVLLLPLLPDKIYSIFDIWRMLGANSGVSNMPEFLLKILEVKFLNPFKVAFIIALVTGFNLFTYLFSKFVRGLKTLYLEAVVGGALSSTATTVSLVTMRISKTVAPVILAVILAQLPSFVSVLFVVVPIASSVAFALFVYMAILFVGGSILWMIFKRWFMPTTDLRESSTNNSLKLELNTNILNLGVAFEFAMMYVVISFLVRIVFNLLGQKAVLLTVPLLGFLGVDMAILTVGELVEGGIFTIKLAIWGITLINLVNFIAKLIYVLTLAKDKVLRKYAGLAILGYVFLSVLAGVVTYLLFT